MYHYDLNIMGKVRVIKALYKSKARCLCPREPHPLGVKGTLDTGQKGEGGPRGGGGLSRWKGHSHSDFSRPPVAHTRMSCPDALGEIRGF